MKKYLFILLIIFTGSFKLLAQPALVEVITTNVSCTGGVDGTVLIRITGGQAPYTYSIFRGGDWQSNPAVMDTFYTFNAVGANSWHITVEDNNADGFSEFNAAIVTEPELAQITGEFITPITCSGFADGELQITAADGSGNYSFELNPGSITSATGIYTPLGPGDYTITLTDVTCATSVVSNTLSLIDPALLSISSETVKDVSCNGGNDGYVHVTAAGGDGSYTYTINPGALEVNADGNFDNYPVGIYSVDVTDGYSCPIVTSNLLEIEEPAVLAIATENFTQVTCNGASDGSVTITASGGTAPYSFTLNPGAVNNATGVFNGLPPGSYTVTLTDPNSCGPVISSTFDIVEPDAIAISTSNFTDITCNNDNDGTIDVTATGGTAPLTYTLNPGAIDINATGSFTGLAGGSYFVNVSDPNGCPEAVAGPILITNPALITIDSEAETDVSCNAADDGTISITASGGTGSLHYTLNPGSILQTDNGNFIGLSPNTYSVTVTDDNTCPAAVSSNFDITEPAVLAIATENFTQVTCNGASDGSVTITASGGTAPYSFTLNPGAVNNATGVFNGLPPGSYTVTLTDPNSCGPVISSTFDIVEPDAIAISTTNFTDITCNNDNDGTIDVTATGGTAPLTYTLNPGAIDINATGSFTGLAGGSYFVNVSDPNGCPEAVAGPILITNPALITIDSEAETDVSCNAADDGTISITASGGTGSLHYTLNPGSILQTDNGNFIGLSPNTYSVTVTDDNTCPAAVSSNFDITEPAVLAIATENFTQVTCNGASDGSVTITASGGTAPYSFTLNPGAVNNATGIFNGLPPGSYTVTLTDPNSCGPVLSSTFDIVEPDAIAISTTNFTDITCNNDNDGTIDVTAIGGTAPLTYTLNPGAIDVNATGSFTGLAGGSYFVNVSDPNGCPEAVAGPILITNPALITIDSEAETDVSCNAADDGTISITASGGTGSLHYTLNPGSILQTDNGNFIGLSPNTYSVTVTDDNTCPAAVSSNFDITEPAVLAIATENFTQVTCNGASDGSVTITASGGTAPYSFTLNPGAVNNATGVFNGLPPGSYTVTLTDPNSCGPVLSSTFDIVEPDAIAISTSNFTDITCNNDNDGTIDVTAIGGTAPLTYTLNPGAIDVNATGSFTGLAGGSYFVNVSDPNGCPEAVAGPILITNPALITIDSEAETDVSCNTADDGTISITASGGTGSLHYTLNPGSVLQTDNGNFIGLSPNTYSVTVTDDNTCPAAVSSNFDITEPAAITLLTISSNDISCFGVTDGRIDVVAAGGTGPYSYELNPGAISNTDGKFTGLGQGTYSITVIDASLCSEIFTDIATIVEPPELQISLAKTDIQCYGDADGTITVTASGGTPGYEYSRNNIVFQASNEFTGLTPNTFTIWVRDASGCLTSDLITINEPPELLITSELSVNNNICFGDSLGEIRILAVEGGVLPYSYSIDAGLTYVSTSDFQNLPAGNYQVMVKDANNCETSGSLLNINQPQEIKILTYNQVDIPDCYGDLSGQIAIEGTGGTGPKTYSLDGGLANLTGIFNTVSGGNHTIRIKDDNNCQKDTTVTILEPLEIVLTGITLTDISGCPGNNDGIIDATAIGGTGSLLFSVDASAFQGSGTFNSQLAGNHILSVKDDNNCQIDSTVSLSEPTALSIDTETATEVSCAGFTDGTVSISVSGGTAPYLFTLNPGAISNASGSFNSLIPGDYTISFDDSNNCGPLSSNTLTVTEPSAVIVDSILSSDILCASNNDAEIHIYVSGGTGPYEYSIDDGASLHSTSDFLALGPGTYHVSVLDANSCPLAIDTINFVDPPALTLVTETSTDVAACFGDSTGSVEFEVNGGTGILEYSIDNKTSWQATGLYTSLPAGDFTIIAMDQNNCELSSAILTIDQPLEITADIITTPALDASSLGSISITNTIGGTGALEFSITGGAGPFTAQTDYPDLIAGFYDVVIQDANLCNYEETVEVVQIQPLNVTVSISHLTCNGSDDGSILMVANDATGTPEFSIDDSLTWSNNGLFENLTGGEYIIFARDEDDRYFADTIIVIDPIAIGIFSNITPASCSNLSEDGAIDITITGASGSPSIEWSTGAITEDLNNINSGSYWINVIDENLCSATDTVVVPGLTNVTADAGQDTSICFGETLVLNGLGGTTASWTPIAGLSNPNIGNPVVDTDTSISYYLTVVGINDCYDIDTINITVFPYLGLNAGNDTSVIINESISITTTGGPYISYLWDPANGVDDSLSAAPTITPTASTHYIVSGLTEDGCYDRDTIMITLVENLVIYNAFSPNFDGRNDYWDIDYAAYYPDILVEVYNRWGERIFHSVGYSDDKRWDGTSKGKEVPFGTYYYVVIPYSGATPVTGPITIVR